VSAATFIACLKVSVLFGSVHQSNYSFQCDDTWPTGVMLQCHRSRYILIAICYARSSL